MTSKEIDKIKLTKRWPINFSFFCSYTVILLPISVLSIGLIMLKNNVEELIISLFIFTLGILLTFLIIKRLWQNQTFKLIKIENLTCEKVELAIRKENFGSPKFDNLGYIIVTTETSLFSWGEEITIIKDGNKFYINSKPYSQPITILKDRNNIKKIIKSLKSTI